MFIRRKLFIFCRNMSFVAIAKRVVSEVHDKHRNADRVHIGLGSIIVMPQSHLRGLVMRASLYSMEGGPFGEVRGKSKVHEFKCTVRRQHCVIKLQVHMADMLGVHVLYPVQNHSPVGSDEFEPEVC